MLSLLRVLPLLAAPASTQDASIAIHEVQLPSGATYFNVSNVTAALDHHFAEFGATNSTDVSYFIFESETFITNITYPAANDTELTKRWDASNAPLGTWFHQYQIARNGYWDQPWKPGSSCAAVSQGDSVWLEWLDSKSMTVASGFNVDFSIAIQSQWNVPIAKQRSDSRTLMCTATHGGPWARVFTSRGMAWHDQQRQKCVRRDYGRNGLHCDAWGAYMHGDFPTDYDPQTGCSTGGNPQTWC